MYYVRAHLTDEVSVEVDISNKNVFTHCADCGSEIEVDLDDLIGLEDFSLNSALCCEKCSIRQLAERRDGP